ncbi:MAG: phage integrase SAM-like domain and Arm DNA-binding domain-containing protein [Bacteroidota bacterium]
MQHSLSILFYLRKSKENKQGEAPVYLRITVNGKRVDLSTNRFISDDQWDNGSGRVKGFKEDAKVLNNYLSGLENKVYQEYNILISKQEPISPEILRNQILGIQEEQRTFMELIRFHTQQIKEQIGNGFSEGTYKRYIVTIGKLEKFLLFQYKKSDIALASLNHEFITNFEYYLKTQDKISHNTVVKYIKILKKVANLAVAFIKIIIGCYNSKIVLPLWLEDMIREKWMYNPTSRQIVHPCVRGIVRNGNSEQREMKAFHIKILFGP